ncbi:MAG: AmmeMemoRadiSam system protein A [Candidatus Acidiferrales bacterium]
MFRLSSEDWLALAEIARRSISTAVLERRLPDFPPYPETLRISRGAFVTLYRGGKLRGCVGQVEDLGPLAEIVARAAIGAALHDPRFPPVAAEELSRLEIELSVLSPLEPIAPESIVAGVHGLQVTRERRRGILLPQVAAERGWTSRKLLEETCEKAGLRPDAWRDAETRILAFTAELFREAGVRTKTDS